MRGELTAEFVRRKLGGTALDTQVAFAGQCAKYAVQLIVTPNPNVSDLDRRAVESIGPLPRTSLLPGASFWSDLKKLDQFSDRAGEVRSSLLRLRPTDGHVAHAIDAVRHALATAEHAGRCRYNDLYWSGQAADEAMMDINLDTRTTERAVQKHRREATQAAVMAVLAACEAGGRELAREVSSRLRSPEALVARTESGTQCHWRRNVPKVFICYAKQDVETAVRIFCSLRDEGYEPWLDCRSLVLGDIWEHEIKKAVSMADAFVVCLTPGFDQIGFRQREVRWALKALELRPPGMVFVIPFIARPCEIPAWCSPYHAGSRTTEATQLADLLAALRKHFWRLRRR